MSTVEDFKNAPVGATATHKATGNRAMKMDDSEQGWIIRVEDYLANEEMVSWGYTLDPIGPRPTSAHEALDLAWELAHEVKDWRAIPRGTRLLEFNGSEVKAYTARREFTLHPERVPVTRTVDPLPDPKPEWIDATAPQWLDAPAVMARLKSWASDHDPQVFRRETESGTQWSLDTNVYRWDELIDVTPLYLKGQDS